MLKCCWNVFWTDHLQMIIEMMPLFRKRSRTWKGTRKGVDETHHNGSPILCNQVETILEEHLFWLARLSSAGMFRSLSVASDLLIKQKKYLVKLSENWKDIFKLVLRFTLIRFANFWAKIISMAKLLQNYSNLNDFDYSRCRKVRKIEKRPKKILKAKQRPEVEKSKFS